MALEGVIERITGNLQDACNAAVPGTVQCAADIMRDRRDNPALQRQSQYTGDGQVYREEKGKVNWYITDVSNNPVLNNLEAACSQLRNKGNYEVSPEDFKKAKLAKSTTTVDLNQLALTRYDNDISYLAIDTSRELSSFNREEQKAIKQFYGKTPKDFAANMSMLREAGITETRVYVLNPEYVKKQSGPVARASWLFSFINSSSFFAYVSNVDYDYGVRGVRRAVAEGDAQKTAVPVVDDYRKAYETLIAQPQNVTKEIAAGLSQLVAGYLAAKQ